MGRWLLLALACLAWQPSARALGPASEAEVGAAVVFNLLVFIQWPSTSDGGSERQIVLCSLEGGPLEVSLSRMQGRMIHGLPLVVRRIVGGPDESQQCQAVVVEAGSGRAALPRFAAMAARGQPLLIIGEGAGALDNGAMIGLDVAEGRMVIDVDLAALRRARLAASSKLLRLARNLRE